MKVGYLIIGWIIYFFIHSFLASRFVKMKAEGIMGVHYRYYRLVYVFIASFGLLILLYLNSNISANNYFDNNGITRYFSLMLAALGVIIIKVAFRAYHFSSFIGITQEKSQVFVTSGLLGSVRHPIYSGTILIVIGYWLFSPNLPTLASAVCILAYLPIGIYMEEKKLVLEFGNRYLDYRKKVPALFPRLF